MIKKRKKKVYTEVYASNKHISISAHKARRVIDQIRGRSYEETLMILELMPYRACYPIFQLVYSAAANASHNKGFDETGLIISKAQVNEGTTIKKLKPRARGRSYPIKRPTCHISIVLDNIAFDYEKYYEKHPKWLGRCTDSDSGKKGLWDKSLGLLGKTGGLWGKK